MNLRELVGGTEEFEWDRWNIEKNFQKHNVGPYECEEVFFNEPIVEMIPLSVEHGEQRYFVIGKTNAGRLLSIVFTLRKIRIRVISARDSSRKERRGRNDKIKKSPKI